MNRPPPRILSIAGSDSSGGAGIQADVKTITMLGGYAMTAITAVTAQNTQGVQAVDAMPANLVGAQIAACLGDIGADAVKIGMVGSPAIASAIVEQLHGFDGPVVFDPVMVATAGSALADDGTVECFSRLMDRASIVTPNLPELAVLSRMPAGSADEIIGAAQSLAERHQVQVLAKGGHATDPDKVTDRIVSPTGKMASFTHARIDTRHTHGTGCTLSAALATLLGHGQPLTHAIRLARAFTLSAIENAPGFGKGSGPLGHQAVRHSG